MPFEDSLARKWESSKRQKQFQNPLNRVKQAKAIKCHAKYGYARTGEPSALWGSALLRYWIPFEFLIHGVLTTSDGHFVLVIGCLNPDLLRRELALGHRSESALHESSLHQSFGYRFIRV